MLQKDNSVFGMWKSPSIFRSIKNNFHKDATLFASNNSLPLRCQVNMSIVKEVRGFSKKRTVILIYAKKILKLSMKWVQRDHSKDLNVIKILYRSSCFSAAGWRSDVASSSTGLIPCPGKWVKDLALPLLWLRLDPWPRNYHTMGRVKK